MNTRHENIRSKFLDKKVVIIGDLVADQFLRGTISRVSREAPVFILRHDETETLAGGAANASVNVSSLGGNAVLVGLVGKDSTGNSLLESLKREKVNCDHVIATEKIQTTTKVRVLAGQHYAPRQQVIRIDYENSNRIDEKLQDKLKQNLLSSVEKAEAIIVSDYNYGVIDQEIVKLANEISKDKNIPLLLDSRFNLQNYPNATTATPNQEEVEHILGKDFDENDCIKLCDKLGYDSLLITRGNKGMLLIEQGKIPVILDAIGSKEPVDVTGAGDTVIAAYALGLASGLTFAESANIANHAGGIVVMKKGTASVSFDELGASLQSDARDEFETHAS